MEKNFFARLSSFDFLSLTPWFSNTTDSKKLKFEKIDDRSPGFKVKGFSWVENRPK